MNHFSYFRQLMANRGDFEREMEQEVIKSERARARFVGLFFALLLVLTLVLGIAHLADLKAVFGSEFSLVPVIITLAAYTIYEFGFRAAAGLFWKRGIKFPLAAKIFNAFVEISFPTLAILLLFKFVSPEVDLSLPPVFLYFIFIALSALRLEPVLSFISGLVGAVEFLLLSFFGAHIESLLGSGRIDADASGALLFWSHIGKAALILAAGMITAFVARQIRNRMRAVFKARDEKNLVSSIFGQYVSPVIMEKLISQRDGLPSELREVCIMFLDIRDFTHYAQNRDPEEVVEFLNKLFEFMIDIVNANKGLINKFLGDGFMAVFGAPVDDGEASANAVRAALQISERLKQELDEGRLIDTRIGIGLHAGRALTGSVGTAGKREYTIIGDVVNLASRIEQLNKQYGSEILVSKEVWDAVEEPTRASLDGNPIELGAVTVKGRDAAVEIIRLR